MKVLRIKYSEDRTSDANGIRFLFEQYNILAIMELQKNERPERMTNYLRIKKIK